MLLQLNKNEHVRAIVFLIFRIWFGYTMVINGKFLFDKGNLDFFLDWFGNKLHLPYPLLMFYLAKGSEFFGGILLILGLLTRVGSLFIAITMLVATLTANIHEILTGDGTITISFCLMSIFYLIHGAGKWSLDYLIFEKILKRRRFQTTERQTGIFIIFINVWFGVVLLYNAIHTNTNDPIYFLIDKLSGSSANFLAKLIEYSCGACILLAIFSRVFSLIIGIIVLVALFCSMINLYDFGTASVYAKIFLWLAGLILFNPQIGKWSYFPMQKMKTSG